MSEQRDLTRWNRAGLSRFTYVDGNAVEYLERLRLKLAEQFPYPAWKRLHDVPDPADENEQQRIRRIEEQYNAQRRDWGWELSRALARASHILASHIDAYANESYLHTASEWDNLRKMVEMLDYHPAPPASASTQLALEIKAGMQGSVDQGLQFKYAPPLGDAVVFETLEDIVVDAELNAVRLQAWDRCTDSFSPYLGNSGSPWLYSEAPKASVGDLVILIQDPEQLGTKTKLGVVERKGIATRITQMDERRLCIGPPAVEIPAVISPWYRGASRLLYGAKESYTAHLNGEDVLRFDQPHGLVANQIITWLQGGAYLFNTVAEVQDSSLRVADRDAMPQYTVYSALRITPILNEAGTALEFRLPLDTQAAVYRLGGVLQVLDMAGDFTIIDSDNGIPQYKLLTNANIDAMELYIGRKGLPYIGQIVPAQTEVYTFDGKPGDLASGVLVAAEGINTDGASILQAMEVVSVNKLDGAFELVLLAVGAAVIESTINSFEIELIQMLRQIEQSVDEPIFRKLTLAELLSGKLADNSVEDIEGIGRKTTQGTSYADLLNAVGIASIGELADTDTDVLPTTMSAVRLREFRSKAERLVRMRLDVSGHTELLPMSLEAIMLRYKELLLVATESSATVGSGTKVFASLHRIHGPFEKTLFPYGYDLNTDPALDAEGYLSLQLSPLPTQLVRGRKVIVEQVDAQGARYPHHTEVEKIDGQRIKLKSLPAAEQPYTLGNTVLRANVVTAGHGEGRNSKVLGSGDATRSSQVFLFKVSGVSFIADATMSSGVRADIEVTVDGRIWRQVATLMDSKPFDHDYTVHMTEDEFLQVTFGDGRHGRRLPSGSNNVRIRYREGTGLQGNIARESLLKASKPHALVKAVRQPFKATGGNDMEDATSLRQNAPPTVLTLERAVSLEDFSRLATAHSSVWQARAVMQNAGYQRKQSIEVVVVPANGDELGDLEDTLQSYLQAHAVPDVQIRMKNYIPIPYRLDVDVFVDAAFYNVEEILPKVEAAVSEHFSLKRRKLGAALYLSEVYKVVENVEGVVYSVAAFEVDSQYQEQIKIQDKVLQTTNHKQVFVLGSVVVNPIDENNSAVARV